MCIGGPHTVPKTVEVNLKVHYSQELAGLNCHLCSVILPYLYSSFGSWGNVQCDFTVSVVFILLLTAEKWIVCHINIYRFQITAPENQCVNDAFGFNDEGTIPGTNVRNAQSCTLHGGVQDVYLCPVICCSVWLICCIAGRMTRHTCRCSKTQQDKAHYLFLWWSSKGWTTCNPKCCMLTGAKAKKEIKLNIDSRKWRLPAQKNKTHLVDLSPKSNHMVCGTLRYFHCPPQWGLSVWFLEQGHAVCVSQLSNMYKLRN